MHSARLFRDEMVFAIELRGELYMYNFLIKLFGQKLSLSAGASGKMFLTNLKRYCFAYFTCQNESFVVSLWKLSMSSRASLLSSVVVVASAVAALVHAFSLTRETITKEKE